MRESMSEADRQCFCPARAVKTRLRSLRGNSSLPVAPGDPIGSLPRTRQRCLVKHGSFWSAVELNPYFDGVLWNALASIANKYGIDLEDTVVVWVAKLIKHATKAKSARSEVIVNLWEECLTF